MDTVSNYLKENPIETRGIAGMSDPAEMNRTLNEMHRNAYRSGGFVSPTVGVTVEDADVDLPHADYMEDLHDEVLSTAGPSAFDTEGRNYAQSRFQYISSQTPMSASVRRDSLNRRMIGYGFNLESPENFALAAGVLNMKPEEIEAIRNGEAIITQAQARSLYEAQVSIADKLISEKTSDEPLRANQRMVLTAMAIHNPELIGPDLSKALREGNGEAAVNEIRNRSNASKSRELRLRRVQDAQHFSNYMTDEDLSAGGANELIHPSAVERSPRPQSRPDRGMPTSLRPQMRPEQGMETSPRPQMRPEQGMETSLRPQMRPEQGMETSLRPQMRPQEAQTVDESWWAKLANIFDEDEPGTEALPIITPQGAEPPVTTGITTPEVTTSVLPPRPGIDTSRPISEQVSLKSGGWLETAINNPSDLGTAFVEGARETLEGVKNGIISAKDSTIVKMNEMAAFFNETKDNVGFDEFTQFAKNYFIPGQTVTADNYDEPELLIMAELINDAIASGNDFVNYKTMDSSEREAMSGGVLGGILDPKVRVRRTLGAFNFTDNGDGTATIRNVYNFNEDPQHGLPDRKLYYDAINEGNADAATDILYKYWERGGYVEIASIFAYVRQERLMEAGKPYETPIEIIVPLQ